MIYLQPHWTQDRQRPDVYGLGLVCRAFAGLVSAGLAAAGWSPPVWSPPVWPPPVWSPPVWPPRSGRRRSVRRRSGRRRSGRRRSGLRGLVAAGLVALGRAVTGPGAAAGFADDAAEFTVFVDVMRLLRPGVAKVLFRRDFLSAVDTSILPKMTLPWILSGFRPEWNKSYRRSLRCRCGSAHCRCR